MQRVDRWHNFHIEPILYLLFSSLEIVSSVAPSGVPTWWIIQARQWRLRWSWCWQSWPRSLIAESCLQVLSLECWVRSALYNCLGRQVQSPESCLMLGPGWWVLSGESWVLIISEQVKGKIHCAICLQFAIRICKEDGDFVDYTIGTKIN